VPITKIELEEAYKQASKELVFDTGGWLDDITTVVSYLKTPAMTNSPIAVEKLALLNTFIMVADSMLGAKKKGKSTKKPLPDGLNNPAKLFILAVKLCL